jgi:transmembrane sensor
MSDQHESSKRAASADPQSGDRLAPYQEALRDRFPSVDAITAQAQARQRRRNTVRTTSAACVLLCAGVAWFANPAYRTEHIATASNEGSTQTLADGSEVQLDGGSTLDIAWRARSREFTLTSGEAMFHAAHGPRAFIVNTGNAEIRDIGTVFDVRRRAAVTRVVVLEGAVEVSAAGHTIALRENQRIDVAANGVPSAVSPVDADGATAWRDGKLAFDGLPLSEAVQEMQPYLRSRIVIDDERTAAMRLSAVFDRDRVAAMVPLLPGILPLTVRKAADGTIHLSARGRS